MMKLQLDNNDKIPKSKITILQKLLIITFLIIGSSALIGFAVYMSSQKQSESQNMVKHSESVIRETNVILAIGLEIEASARGFVISNDSSFLSPYFESKDYYRHLDKLRKLVNDNPDQTKLLDTIEIFMLGYLDFSDIMVEKRSRNGLQAAVNLVSGKAGQKLIKQLRTAISLFQNNENKLLEERKNLNQSSLNIFHNLILAMFWLMGIITVSLLFVIGKNFIQTKDKEKSSAELVSVTKELIYESEEKIKLEAANKELEAFSYSISHDLRAPLRHISGFVELLTKSNSERLNESGIRYLKIITDSATQMGNLIDAILAFSRLGRDELHFTKINTNNMVKKVINDLESDMSGRQIEFNISDLPDVTGDENLINQVWVNLLSNAVKYSKNKERAVIEIGNYTENNFLIFYVKDNGAGFDMQYAPKLFGVFQRLHKAKDFEGIGIGLANVQRIINRHNGKCWAESEINIGAKFYFSMPIILTNYDKEIIL